MPDKIWMVFVAALVPMIVGFIWYNPKVFGNTWMKAASMTPEKIQGGNMPLIFGLSYVMSILLAFFLLISGFIIHQTGLYGLFSNLEGVNEAGSASYQQFQDLQAQFKDMHRTFGHGALHGTLMGIGFALPILATNAMFERKGLAYVLVNGGYWILTLALMGGVLCAFA